jgi:radical SAM-linked protein
MSAGFSPHPKISYANAAPMGAASEAEYVEIGVTAVQDPEQVRAALDAALPPGLDIVDVVVAQTSDFAQRLQASSWQIALPGVSLPDLEAAVAAFAAQAEVLVERTTKSGRRSFDARGAVCALETAQGEGCAILAVVVRHGTPSVRPDDVMTALGAVADLVPPEPPRFTRLAQGPVDERTWRIADPLEADRSAGS